MHRKLTGLAVAATIAVLTNMHAGLAQPTLNPQGGSAGPEMDHSQMGGAPAPGQLPRGPAPTLNPQGGSSNAEMDHSRMGSGNVGSPSGGTITGNSGSGPEVRHGHESGTMPRR